MEHIALCADHHPWLLFVQGVKEHGFLPGIEPTESNQVSKDISKLESQQRKSTQIDSNVQDSKCKAPQIFN